MPANNKRGPEEKRRRSVFLLRIAAVLAALVSAEEMIPYLVLKIQEQNGAKADPATALTARQNAAQAGQHLATGIICLLLCAAALIAAHFMKTKNKEP